MPTLTAAPELADRFRRQGAMIMCVVAFPWTAAGIGVLGEGAAYWAALIAAALITATLAVYSVRHRPRRVVERTIPSDWLRRYNFALFGELALIAVAVVVLIASDVAEIIPGVVAVIVGLHFLPLAKAFGQPLYRITAVGVTLAGVLGIGLFLLTQPDLVGTVAGVGSALTLWWTSLAVTRAG